jgi:predicted transposase YbfD/YdcC
LDKAHGRIEERQLWCKTVSPHTLGLAGVAQVIRIDRDVQVIRGGQVIKQTNETALIVTSLWSDETTPSGLLELVRSHWSIENGQHYRRDRSQDEDRCTVRESTSARNLSLFRSLAIFLFELQRGSQRAKESLPDFERHNLRRPGALIRRFVSG